MARAGSVKVNIDADASGMRRGVDDAEKSLKRLNSVGSKSLKGLGIAATATGAVAFTGLAAAIATGTREMLEQEKVSAQTAAAIKSTGGAAKVTQKEIEDLSSAMQANTGAQDDAVQSAANLLLTFTNVRNEAGRGKDIFNQATQTTLDLSVAFGKDLNSSAILVGKALNSPIQGLSALNRVGVQFTAQQKEQIKTLVDSGRTLDAQKMILKELNTQVGGSAVALGNTVPGQLEKIKRAWEDVSEQLVLEFMPIITQVASAVLRNMDKVERIFEGVKVAVKGLVKFVGALMEGDWRKAWDIAADGAGKALAALGMLAEKVLLPIGRKMGRAIIQGVGEGINAGIFSMRESLPGGSNGILANAIFGDVSSLNLGANINPLTGVDRRPVLGPSVPVRRAGGGFIPGRFDGRDDVPVRLSRGEVVLNPSQQRLVGIDRIVSSLRSTGGVVGGTSFRTGGIVGGAVSSAMERARSNVGEPYGKPSRGESRTGPNSWDCSGYATYIAGVNVGGTTASAYTSSSRAKGTEPIVWGFRKSHGGSYRGGYDEHMGVRVGGVWYQTSGGRTAQTGSDGDWQEIRVPNGLGNLQDGDGGPVGESAVGRPQPLLSRKVIRAIMSRGIGYRGTRPSSSDVASGRIDARHRDDSTQDKRARATGEASARGAGVTNPDKIAAAGEKQVLATRKKEVDMDVADVRSAARRVTISIGRLRTHRKKLYGQLRKARTRDAQQRFIDAIASVNDSIRGLWDEHRGLIRQAADLEAESRDLDYDIGSLSSEIAGMPNAETGGASDAGISADGQAQLDQANARADTAQRGLNISDSFIRTLFGSSSIDPAGGSTPVYVNIEGSLVREGEVASWITGVFGGQGSVPTSTFPSAA